MQAIAGQIRQLEKIVEANPPKSRLSLPPSGTPSPRQHTVSTSESENLEEGDNEDVSPPMSPQGHLQNIERDSSPLSDATKQELKDDVAVEELVKQGGSYECAVS